MASGAPHRVATVAATLGEGPIWVAREKALWFVDIKQHKLYRFDPATRALKSWVTVQFAIVGAGLMALLIAKEHLTIPQIAAAGLCIFAATLAWSALLERRGLFRSERASLHRFRLLREREVRHLQHERDLLEPELPGRLIFRLVRRELRELEEAREVVRDAVPDHLRELVVPVVHARHGVAFGIHVDLLVDVLPDEDEAEHLAREEVRHVLRGGKQLLWQILFPGP